MKKPTPKTNKPPATDVTSDPGGRGNPTNLPGTGHQPNPPKKTPTNNL